MIVAVFYLGKTTKVGASLASTRLGNEESRQTHNYMNGNFGLKWY